EPLCGGHQLWIESQGRTSLDHTLRVEKCEKLAYLRDGTPSACASNPHRTGLSAHTTARGVEARIDTLSSTIQGRGSTATATARADHPGRASVSALATVLCTAGQVDTIPSAHLQACITLGIVGCLVRRIDRGIGNHRSIARRRRSIHDA